MKSKLFLLASGMIFLTGAVNAQVVRFGLKGGANFSAVNANGRDATWGSRTGVHAGLLAHIHLNKSWAIQPEVVYSLQGAKMKVAGQQEQTINLNYVNVPILVQYMFDNGFRLQTGPQAGFLVGANTKVGTTSTSNKEFFNSTDFSWTFGAGYLSNIGLGIDARYNLGLTDIYKPGALRETNGVFQLGLFYMFNHKSK